MLLHKIAFTKSVYAWDFRIPLHFGCNYVCSIYVNGNQNNHFQNPSPCRKRICKRDVATRLKRWSLTIWRNKDGSRECSVDREANPEVRIAERNVDWERSLLGSSESTDGYQSCLVLRKNKFENDSTLTELNLGKSICLKVCKYVSVANPWSLLDN